MLVKADTKKKEAPENLFSSVPKFKRTGLDKSNKNREGVPDPKKFERTGNDSFVVHGNDGSYFEGKVTDPRVKIKPSGSLLFCMNPENAISNPCMECVNNKYHGGLEEVCDACVSYKSYKQRELANVCS
jgi:hypothetical protein